LDESFCKAPATGDNWESNAHDGQVEARNAYDGADDCAFTASFSPLDRWLEKFWWNYRKGDWFGLGLIIRNV
jgi:hypothetical protein